MSKVAVVTGSAGGLGKGIAQRLAKDGFKLVLHDINGDMLADTLKEFKDNGIDAVAVTGDVSKQADQLNLVAEAVKAFDHIDVFINNAGIDAVSPFLEIDEAQLNRLFSINVNGVVLERKQPQNNS